ncbi:BCCT family transporter [Paenibacillus sp. GSMTC-2017]|uniref:glycine betaine uptake BCCT transporter n=1 Tax=Paenibacillus sp. GSMTC-2017 TaxID=2794350 RepID=UPI0018D66CD2|nr:BCCT family transporter [Paenibacillus sp. GSMTC-2017]MBH5317755.1 BCCT family transporter [Paenibacillus sp. GSMTC-2017]
MVFWISLIFILLFVAWGALMPGRMSDLSTIVYDYTIEKFGWFYLMAMFFFLIFAFILAFGKYGGIKLGTDDDEPEYSLTAWFSMLFSTGMGIGLVFWGVAEPLSHYLTPPEGIPGGTPEAARVAMRYSFFHWGLHPWAIYTIVGLALAYHQFRKGRKGLISSTFYPLIGEKGVNGPLGKGIDILAIIATAFGVATSLGLGALQINGGLNAIFGLDNSAFNQMWIIACVTVLFMVSTLSGLDRGIKILSTTNLFMAFLLMIFVFLVGPTAFLMDTLTNTIGSYVQNIVQMSLRLMPFSESNWIGNWTLFYWAWWIAWAPFVGTFIARVSRGRTIKEYVSGVLIVPSLLGFVWFSVFGGTGLHMELMKHIPVAELAQKDVTSALFVTLGHLPFGMIASGLATLLIIIFFVTSADSATFVLGMLSQNGNPNPSASIKLTWGVLQSTIAVVLLLSGGLKGLQTASIITSLPFALIIVGMCFALLRCLKEEDKLHRVRERKRRRKLDELIDQHDV